MISGWLSIGGDNMLEGKCNFCVNILSNIFVINNVIFKITISIFNKDLPFIKSPFSEEFVVNMNIPVNEK